LLDQVLSLLINLQVAEFLDDLLLLILRLNRLDLFWYLGFLKDVRLSRDLPNHLRGILSLDNLIIGIVSSDDLDILDLYLT
jgi:hypothetical protein